LRWAPRLAIAKFTDGTGKRVPAGAKIDFELHYTTTGSPQTDQTEVALYLLPGKPQREVTTRAAVQLDLNIPLGAMNHATQPSTDLNVGHDLFLHPAHASARTLDAIRTADADWKRETLLRVPRYDFNWQTSYQLAEPRTCRLVPG